MRKAIRSLMGPLLILAMVLPLLSPSVWAAKTEGPVDLSKSSAQVTLSCMRKGDTVTAGDHWLILGSHRTELWNQWECWAGYSVSGSGCGYCVIAEAANLCGVLATPDSVLSALGRSRDKGRASNAEDAVTYFEGLGISTEKYVTDSVEDAKEILQRALDSGRMVMLPTKDEGSVFSSARHWVLLCGYDEKGSVIAANPGNRAKKSGQHQSVTIEQAANALLLNNSNYCMIAIDRAELSYNGEEQTPDVTVTVRDTTLAEGQDYQVSYTDNQEAGVAAVTITGKGNYTGTLTRHFFIWLQTPELTDIVSTPEGVRLTWKKVEGAAAYRVFRKSGSGWDMLADVTGASILLVKPRAGVSDTYTVCCVSKDGTSCVSGFDSTGKTMMYLPDSYRLRRRLPMISR